MGNRLFQTRLSQRFIGFNRGMRVKIKTEPTVEPVTVADLTDAGNDFLKIEFDEDDTLIGEMITAARRVAEEHVNRKFITQTLTVYWDEFAMELPLPYPPHISVTSVKRLFKDTTTTLTLNTDYFQLGTNTSDFILKDLDLHGGQSLEVEYVVGYGAAATDVPEAIRHAIMRIVAGMYDFRTDFVEGKTISTIPLDSRRLLEPFRIYIY